ncbi:MAG: methylamine utilization protein [Verrucomicrobia bacterium]|nr:methylamine utilization protein [Verrucomicrobiota bacterium]
MRFDFLPTTGSVRGSGFWRRLGISLVLGAGFLGGPLAARNGFEAVVVDAAGELVSDVVLSLTPLDGQAMPPSVAGEAKISQIKQEYSPYVTAVRTGTPVEFPNLDTIQHHIYSVSKPKRFEIPLYEPGRSEVVTFDQPGLVVIGCNIHDWMSAYVLVLDTPWFGKTTADGRVSLADLPSGRYRLELWHPRVSKPLSREVTLGTTSGAEPLRLTLALRPDRRLRRAPTPGAGGAY